MIKLDADSQMKTKKLEKLQRQKPNKTETVNSKPLIKRKDELTYEKYARKPFNGIEKVFHENGQLWFKRKFRNGKHVYETVNSKTLIKRKDGLTYKKYARKPFNGIEEAFHENGQLWFKRKFRNGKRVYVDTFLPFKSKEDMKYFVQKEELIKQKQIKTELNKKMKEKSKLERKKRLQREKELLKKQNQLFVSKQKKKDA